MGHAIEVRKGLENVIVDSSTICYVDPDGGLIYRGYWLEELAEKSTFEEVCYLLIHGKLPTKYELEKFKVELVKERELPEELYEVLYSFPKDAHPMDLIRTSVSFLGSVDPEAMDYSHDSNVRKAIKLIAKMPTIVANSYRISKGMEPLHPVMEFSHAKNFLFMIKGSEPDEFSTKVFDITLMLYAEHEFNASSFSARVTASTLSDMYSAITSAIGTLKGPLHGGANEKAMKMMLEIGSVEKTETWILESLKRGERIMGFGHRVYKKEDKRATLLKKYSKLLAERSGDRKWYEMSALIEDIMRREKNIIPNVDFYCASVYYYLGIPMELYTPIFAAARVVGWAAHVIEQHDNNRLIRPRASYEGPMGLKYTPIDQRS